jgi:hypothetical protein
MESLDGTEIWRTIPPEEKLELMSQAHAKGIFVVLISLIIAGTIAVGLKLSWVLWGTLIASPFIFQFSAGKEWRGRRPRLVLEYLAARAAARRYAFSAKGKDLSVSMIFRGTLAEEFGEDKVQEALEAALENNREAAVWIALFGDSFVMMSEEIGGAKLQLAQVLNDRLSVDSKPGPSGKDYANGKELYLTVRSKRESERRYRVTSKHAAALVVFEKKLRMQMNSLKQAAALEIPQLEDEEIVEGESRDTSGDDMQIPVLDEY